MPRVSRVDNPGEGDCGYYAIAVAMIPAMLNELKTIANDMHESSIEIILSDPAKEGRFYNYLSEPESLNKFPFLSRIYNGHMEFSKGQKDQRKIFTNWLHDMFRYSCDLENIESGFPRAVLLPVMHSLRHILSRVREDALSGTILELQRDELFGSNRSRDRVVAFERAGNKSDLGTKIISDILTVFLKHTGGLSEVDDTSGATIKDKVYCSPLRQWHS